MVGVLGLYKNRNQTLLEKGICLASLEENVYMACAVVYIVLDCLCEMDSILAVLVVYLVYKRLVKRSRYPPQKR